MTLSLKRKVHVYGIIIKTVMLKKHLKKIQGGDSITKKNLQLDIPKTSIEEKDLRKHFDKYFSNMEKNKMNYDRTYHIELKDMGNDRETWFVKDISSDKKIEIADYNYRDEASFMDFSPKYGMFLYILSTWNYKGGSHYYLHVHYKEEFYEYYLSHDNYARLTISPCGEKLIIAIGSLAIYELELKDLVEVFENNVILTKGKCFMNSEMLAKKRELEGKSEEAKIGYRLNYPDEFGDD